MSPLDEVIAELQREPHLWWGHNEEHGWVVLDREDARNDGETRYLTRCRDWSQIEVSRLDFGSDRFKSFRTYIKALPADKALEACRKLLELNREFTAKAEKFRVTKADLERRAQEAARQAIINRHRGFFEARNLPVPSVRLLTGRRHRVTHCYNCRSPLDSLVDVECSACEWIICRCGACGCGWYEALEKMKKR